MIRVTTNSTLHMYQSNLMQSSNQLYSAMEKLMTGRNFDSYASNPAGATRAFKLHSALNAVNAQAANNETVLNKFGTAYSILDEVTNELDIPTLTILEDSPTTWRRLPHWAAWTTAISARSTPTPRSSARARTPLFKCSMASMRTTLFLTAPKQERLPSPFRRIRARIPPWTCLPSGAGGWMFRTTMMSIWT